uniref:Uncharacterized protein n=1 Tax=Meloidogyne incognita TaxID=6306 RepID=A0A914KWM4_MELIC
MSIPKTFHLDGIYCLPEHEFYNLPNNVLEKQHGNRPLRENGNKIHTIKNMIINKILKIKKPNTDESLFQIFENEPRLVCTYDTFDCFLIEEDNHRKDAYYITRNKCLRNWLYGIMPDIMRRGFKNFVICGESYEIGFESDPLKINNQILIIFKN